MDAKQIDRFVQHFERITRHMLQQLPSRVDYLYCLDPHRKIL